MPLTLAIDRHSSASTTVRPEAKIAGPAVRSASAQRLVAVVVLAQLLAVARDEQQRVVGPRAEHEDDRIDDDWPLTVTPASVSAVAERARQRARRTTTAKSGINQKTGLR